MTDAELRRRQERTRLVLLYARGTAKPRSTRALQLLVDLAHLLGVDEFERLAARAAVRARLEQQEPLHRS
jgi:hypothetical protein